MFVSVCADVLYMLPCGDNSDAYRVHVCDKCGLIAIANLRKQSFEVCIMQLVCSVHVALNSYQKQHCVVLVVYS